MIRPSLTDYDYHCGRGGEEVDRGGAQEREGQRGGARAPRGPHGRTLRRRYPYLVC